MSRIPIDTDTEPFSVSPVSGTVSVSVTRSKELYSSKSAV